MAKTDPTATDIDLKRMSNDELDNFGTSQEEIEAFLQSIGLTLEDAIFRGSEFERVDKADLVGTPLFFIQWQFRESEQYNSTYAVVHAIETLTGRKVVFADGGLGVAHDLQKVTDKRIAAGLGRAAQKGLGVPAGLVRSDYPAGFDQNGTERPAGTTYYMG